MKIVLRSVRTGLYFQSFGHWTALSEEAQHFADGAHAATAAAANSLADVEIVIIFDDARPNLRVPVRLSSGGQHT